MSICSTTGAPVVTPKNQNPQEKWLPEASGLGGLLRGHNILLSKAPGHTRIENLLRGVIPAVLPEPPRCEAKQ